MSDPSGQGAGSSRELTDEQKGAIALMGISGGVGGFLQSQTQNVLLESQMRQTERSVAFGQGQIERAAGAQIRDRARASAQRRDRLRVTEAETGLSTGTLSNEEAIRLGENIAATKANATSQSAQLFIAGSQNIQSLQNQKTNPWMQGTSGALSGLTAGLQIATLGGNINKAIELDNKASGVEKFNAGTSASDASVNTQVFSATGSAPSGEFNLLNIGRTFDR